MESNSNDNYVLVLEDRTEVKNEKEMGKLSVVSGIDDKGNLKTTEATAANQTAFLKFNNKDGLLKNFMTNFLKQSITQLILGCTRYWQTMWSKAWTTCAPCSKAVKSPKASSSWLRWAFPLRTICPSRRMPPLSTLKRWIGRCSTISVFPVSDWSRVENWKRCSIGRRAIS